MGLKGDLLSADLSNVFQMLAMNRKSGRLLVQDQAELLNRRELFIDDDRVCLLGTPSDRSAEAILVQTGSLDYDTLVEARERSRRYPVTVISALTQAGAVSEADLDDVSRRREEEDILEIFLWRNVRFSLDESGRPPVDRPQFPLDQVVMEAARRQDEWLHATGSGEGRHAIFERVGDPWTHPDLGALNAVHRLVLDEVDGVADRRVISTRTGLSRYFVDVGLHALEDSGFIRQLSLDELIERSDELAQQRRPMDAIRLLRGALRHDRRNATIHERLARSLAETAPAKAAAHLVFCAKERAAAGEVSLAVDHFVAARDLIPTDDRTLEHALRLLSEAPQLLESRHRPLLEEGKRLLALRRDVAEPIESVALARCLAKADPADANMVEQYARVCLRAGRKEEAALAYKDLAEAKIRAKDVRGAIEILRNLGSLDPRNRGLYDQKLQTLLAGESHATNRRRRSQRMAGIVLGLAVLGGLFAFYCRLGDEKLRAIPEREAETIAEAEAMARTFERLSKIYFLTPSASASRQRETLARDRARMLRSTQQQEQADRSERLKREIDSARSLLQSGERALRQGDLVTALSCFERAQQLCASNEGPSWIGRNAQKSADDVRAYLEKGRGLLAASKAQALEGELEASYATLRRVLADFPLVPELTDATIPLDVRVLPADSDLSVDGQPVSQGPVSLPVTGQVRLSARAPGHRDRSVTLDLPPRGPRLTLVLEPEAPTRFDLGQSVVGLGLGSQRLAILTTQGRLHSSPVGSVGSFSVLTPEALISVARPPALEGDLLVYLTEDGELRGIDLTGPRMRFATRVFDRVAGGVDSPMFVPEGIVVAHHDGRLALVDRQAGNVLARREFPGGCVRVAAAGARVAVLGKDGHLTVMDSRDLETTHQHPGPFTDLIGLLDQNRAILRQPSGLAIHRLEDGDGAPTKLEDSEFPAASASLHGGIATSFRNSTLVVHDGLALREVPTDMTISGILGVAPAGIAVVGEGQRVILLDPASGASKAAVTLDSSPIAAVTFRGRFLVVTATGSLVSVPITP